MAENIAAKLRNIVYNGADEITIHKALLEAAGALDDIEAEYEAKIKTMGTNAYKIWHCLVSATNDMKTMADIHMVCDCCKHLKDDGTCGNPNSDAGACWVWRGFGIAAKEILDEAAKEEKSDENA